MATTTYSYVAITRADGGVSIMSLPDTVYTPDGLAVTRTITAPVVDAVVKEWAVTANPEWLPIVGWRPIAQEDIPQNRTLRNAMTDLGDAFSYDQVKVAALPKS